MRMICRLPVVMLLGAALVSTGCTTTRPVWTDAATVPPPGSGRMLTLTELRAGDRVSVTMASGSVRRLKLTATGPDRLAGVDMDAKGDATTVEVSIAEVRSLEARRTSVLKTGALGVGIAAGTFVVAALSWMLKCNYIGGGQDQCSD